MAFIYEGNFFEHVLSFYPLYPWIDVEGDGELYYPFDIKRTKDANGQEVYVLSLFQRPTQGLVENYDDAPRADDKGFSRPRIFYFSTEFVDSL